MKKILAMLLVVAMLFCMVACSSFGGKDTDPNDTTAPSTTEPSTAEPTTEPTEEPTTEEPTTEEPSEEPTEPSETEPATEEPAEGDSEPLVIPEVDGKDIDLSAAVEMPSVESPAKVGEWIKSTRYNATSSSYETIYWRIVGTTFDCQADIDRYNSEDHFTSFEPLENPVLSYCKVAYQVYFPEDFTAPEWGISGQELSLRACNPNGGGIQYQGMSYIGLGSCYDISIEQDIMPGDVFTGEAIYIMIDDPSIEYVFEYYHQELGTDGEMLYDIVSSR